MFYGFGNGYWYFVCFVIIKIDVVFVVVDYG